MKSRLMCLLAGLIYAAVAVGDPQFGVCFSFKSGTNADGCTGRILEPDWMYRVTTTSEKEYPYTNWYHTAIAITNCGTERVRLELVKGGLKDSDGVSVEVWTDREMFDHIGVSDYASQAKESDGDAYNLNYLGLGYYSGNQYRFWAKNIWPDNRVVSSRQWAIISVANQNEWSGAPQFALRIKGTKVQSQPITLRRADYWFSPSDVFGLNLTGYVDGKQSSRLKVSQWVRCNADSIPDESNPYAWERVRGNPMIYEISFDLPEMEEHKSCFIRVPVQGPGHLVVKLPYYTQGATMYASQIEVSGTAYTGETIEYFDPVYNWEGQSDGKNYYSMSIPVSRNGYVDLKPLDTLGILVEKLAFYPAANKCVNVMADYRDWAPCYANVDHEFGLRSSPLAGRGWQIGGINTIRCRVSGCTSYNVGSKATIVCTPGINETFDHWEFVNMSEPYGATVQSSTLTFTVPDISGDYPEIHVRPVLKPRNDGVGPTCPDWVVGKWTGELRLHDGYELHKVGAYVMTVSDEGAWTSRCTWIKNGGSEKQVLDLTAEVTNITVISESEVRVAGRFVSGSNFDWEAVYRKSGESYYSAHMSGLTYDRMEGPCRKVADDAEVYQVYFNPNGASGLIDMMSCVRGNVYLLPKFATLSVTPPSSKTFAGWQCSDGKRYDEGVLIFNLAESGETVTMTAIWE